MSRRQGTVTQVPAGIKGAFRISLADRATWWSPGMFTLHGYRTGRGPQLMPTTRLMAGQVHPEDRRAAGDAWAHLISDGHLIALHYRVLGADGITRPVFVLASTDLNQDHPPTMVTGVMEFDAPWTGLSRSR
ncbi:MAG: PAS domain-containing protein [Nakamurella sp.]